MNYLSKQFRYLKQGAIFMTAFVAIMVIGMLVGMFIFFFVYFVITDNNDADFDAFLLSPNYELIVWFFAIVVIMPFCSYVYSTGWNKGGLGKIQG